jgi:two-component system KDP operon response regulator KdpE
VLTHHQIFREIWGSDGADNLSYIRVYLTNLRKKLAPRLIITEPKVGYRLALSD